MRGWICGCCGRWRVSVEWIGGRYRYRLARHYLADVGGLDVLGEVDSIAALQELLRTRTTIGLADLREVG